MSANHLNAKGAAYGTPQTIFYKTTKRIIPAKDNDFGELCTSVSKRWKEMPVFTLRCMTQQAFEDKAARFKSLLNSNRQAKGDRSPLTLRLQKADQAMERGIAAVKIYLKEKYEKEAKAYYALFGLERINKGYMLPYDRNKRRNVLNRIVAGIATEGFGHKRYGTVFWTGLANEYSHLLDMAIRMDGERSSDTGIRKLLKAELTMVLHAIIKLVGAQYPGHTANELRNWGFQKDKY